MMSGAQPASYCMGIDRSFVWDTLHDIIWGTSWGHNAFDDCSSGWNR